MGRVQQWPVAGIARRVGGPYAGVARIFELATEGMVLVVDVVVVLCGESVASPGPADGHVGLEDGDGVTYYGCGFFAQFAVL